MSGFWSYPNRVVVSNIFNFGVLVAQVATKNWILTMLRKNPTLSANILLHPWLPRFGLRGSTTKNQWKRCFFFSFGRRYEIHFIEHLVGGWTNPIGKILAKLEIFPKFRGENKKYLKPPTKHCRAFGVNDNFLQIPLRLGKKRKIDIKITNQSPQSSPKICGGLCFVSDWFPPLPKSPIFRMCCGGMFFLAMVSKK